MGQPGEWTNWDNVDPLSGHQLGRISSHRGVTAIVFDQRFELVFFLRDVFNQFVKKLFFFYELLRNP